VKLIITVNHINHAFAVYDTESEVVELIPYVHALEDQLSYKVDKPPMHPYGITTDDKHIYIVSHRKVGQFDKCTFEFKGLHPIQTDINTHQLVFFHGELITANTQQHALSIYSCGHTTLFDVCDADQHVNSLAVYNDHLYVSIRYLSKDADFRCWIKVYDRYFNLVDQYNTIMRKQHNIHVDDTHVYTLCSRDYKLVKINRKTKKSQSVHLGLPPSYYMRGLQYHDDTMYIMASIDPWDFHTADASKPALLLTIKDNDLTIVDIPDILTPVSDIHIL